MKFPILILTILSLLSCQNNEHASVTMSALKEEVEVDTCISVKQETEFTLGMKLNMTHLEYNQQIKYLINNSSISNDTTLLLVIPSLDSDIKENLTLEPYFDGCYLKKLQLTGIHNMDAIKDILVDKYGSPTKFHTAQDEVGQAFWSNPALQKPFDSPSSTDNNENTTNSRITIKSKSLKWQWPQRYYWLTSDLKITLEDYSITYQSLKELNRIKEQKLQMENDRKFENKKKIEEARKSL